MVLKEFFVLERVDWDTFIDSLSLIEAFEDAFESTLDVGLVAWNALDNTWALAGKLLGEDCPF